MRGLVHGAIFTRGPKDLKNTAIFIGGSSMPAAERLLVAAREAFFGPFRVSMMLDPNGSQHHGRGGGRQARARGRRRRARPPGRGAGGDGARGGARRGAADCRLGARGEDHVARRRARRAVGASRSASASRARSSSPCRRRTPGASRRSGLRRELVLAAGPAGVQLVAARRVGRAVRAARGGRRERGAACRHRGSRGRRRRTPCATASGRVRRPGRSAASR